MSVVIGGRFGPIRMRARRRDWWTVRHQQWIKRVREERG